MYKYYIFSKRTQIHNSKTPILHYSDVNGVITAALALRLTVQIVLKRQPTNFHKLNSGQQHAKYFEPTERSDFNSKQCAPIFNSTNQHCGSLCFSCCNLCLSAQTLHQVLVKRAEQHKNG